MNLFGGGEEQKWNIQEVQDLDWRELELMIGAALQLKGYDVEITPPVNDGGRDVDADKIDLLRSILFRPKIRPRREKLVIDAKQWKNPVGSSPVIDIADTAKEQGGKGVIASPSGFYESAEEAARMRSVKLYDGERIMELFNETGVDESDID